MDVEHRHNARRTQCEPCLGLCCIHIIQNEIQKSTAELQPCIMYVASMSLRPGNGPGVPVVDSDSGSVSFRFRADLVTSLEDVPSINKILHAPATRWLWINYVHVHSTRFPRTCSLLPTRARYSTPTDLSPSRLGFGYSCRAVCSSHCR